MRFYVTSLGCKLNQSEMESLARQLAEAGQEIVEDPQDADWCLVNTCMVTHIAARKSRQAIRRLHRASPTARLAVTGCYAELCPEESAALAGVDMVVGNQAKAHMVTSILENAPERTVPVPSTNPMLPHAASRTRAFVKIQDGCDNRCTYCVVRIARGSQRSRPVEEILAEVSSRVGEGCKEIVLTGVHIGSYGKDGSWGGRRTSLHDLVGRVLGETSIARIRLSSIEPWDFDPDMLTLWQDSRLCRHLHLPLQSGCDATLRRMGRRYTASEFACCVRLARQQIPGLAVTTDVMVGFPGETDDEFAESLAFVRQASFARLHVFKYSPREGTLAAGMPDQVAENVKSARSETMRARGEEAGRAFARRFIGKVLSVLWETPVDTASGVFWKGLTDNYIRVYAQSSQDLHNTVTPTELTALLSDGLLGTAVV